MTGYLRKQLNRGNRNFLILILLVTIVTFFFVYFPVTGYLEAQSEPLPFHVSVLDDNQIGIFASAQRFVLDAKELPFLNLGPELYKMTSTIGKKKIDLSADEDYLLVKFNDTWIPVRFAHGQAKEKQIYIGSITPLIDDIKLELIKRASKSKDFDPAKLAISYLDTETRPYPLFSNPVVWVGAALLLFDLILLLWFALRLFRPGGILGIKLLMLYGDRKKLIPHITNELNDSLLFDGRIKITKSWILIPTTFSLEIVPFTYLLGAYSEDDWVKIPFTLIPIIKQYKINFLLRNNLVFTAKIRRKHEVEEIINLMQLHASWLQFGEKKELLPKFKKSFASFKSEVDSALAHSEKSIETMRIFMPSKFFMEAESKSAEVQLSDIEGDTQDQLMTKLKKYSFDAWFPVIEQRSGTVAESKFGGTPYLEVGDEIPQCKICQKPMKLLLQLNYSEVPFEIEGLLDFDDGFLQIYCCNDGACLSSDASELISSGVCSIQYKDVDSTSIDISADDFAPDPFQFERIVDWNTIKDYASLFEVFKEVGSEFNVTYAGDKVSAFANWHEAPVYPKCTACKKDLFFVMQINLSDHEEFRNAGNKTLYFLTCEVHPGLNAALLQG
ncbi:MAG: DUF1963 domain-containing protein [Clostridia bacterium]